MTKGSGTTRISKKLVATKRQLSSEIGKARAELVKEFKRAKDTLTKAERELLAYVKKHPEEAMKFAGEVTAGIIASITAAIAKRKKKKESL